MCPRLTAILYAKNDWSWTARIANPLPEYCSHISTATWQIFHSKKSSRGTRLLSCTVQEPIQCATLNRIYVNSSSIGQSVAVLEWFLLAMTLHPDVQSRAHKELDAVLQHDRLPTFEDALPYITAIVKESLRWNPTTPLGTLHHNSWRHAASLIAIQGVAHSVVEDDVAFGYFIPKGATLIANIWYLKLLLHVRDIYTMLRRAILHDESVYHEPLAFKPERFLGPNPEPDPTVAFGFGRCVC